MGIIGFSFPVEGIEDLAARVHGQRQSLETDLTALRSACQRNTIFSGTAASKYDEYLEQWDVNMLGLCQALEGVGNILKQLSLLLQETDSAAAQAF